jgi:hypothetical protein
MEEKEIKHNGQNIVLWELSGLVVALSLQMQCDIWLFEDMGSMLLKCMPYSWHTPNQFESANFCHSK